MILNYDLGNTTFPKRRTVLMTNTRSYAMNLSVFILPKLSAASVGHIVE